MYTNQCPRCGCISFEHLSTHSHCYNCNYSPEEDYRLSKWRELEFKSSQKSKLQHFRDPLNFSAHSVMTGTGGVL
ncbi:MAG: hypothetical protein KDD58_06680 [Bdellovibrionales bacterium]|nr:hypothetical protein [Bdellovibrionales bacterium]